MTINVTTAGVDTVVTGTGLPVVSTRIKIDGVIVGSNFTPAADGSFLRRVVASTEKDETLDVEQYNSSTRKWSMVARLAPLLTFGKLAVVDTTPPIVTGVTANNITSTSVLISWTTNELANSQVDYGLTTGYLIGPTPLDTAFVTTHATPITGLTASTLYHYRVRTIDRKGNLTVGADGTFTTTAGGVTDTTAPVITNIVAVPTSSGVTITWTTDEVSTAQFDYGLTTAYGSSSPLDPSFTTTSHSRTVTGLQPNTTYYYRVRSIDPSGNVAQSSGLSLSTYAQIVVADGATSYWRLGEPSGTSAVDAVSGINGVYTNAPTLGVAGAVAGNTAVTLNGSTQYITVADAVGIEPGNTSWTYELWLKSRLAPTTGSGFLLMKGNVGNASPQLFFDSGVAGRLVTYSDGWGAGAHSSVNITDTNWHHVVITKDASHAWSIYLDGVDVTIVDAASQTGPQAAGPLEFGRKTNNTNYFDGSIDEVGFYKGIALTPNQVASHYSGTLSSAASFTTTPATGGVYTPSGPITVPNNDYVIEWKILDSLPNQAMTLAGQQGIGIYANGKRNLTIRNCILRGRRWGILAIDCDNLTIGPNVQITDVDYAGIAVGSGTLGSISGVTVQRVGMLRVVANDPQINNAYGIIFQKSSTYGLSSNNAPPTNFTVSNYLIEDSPLWMGINAHQASHLTVQNGIIRRCPRGMFFCGQIDHIDLLNNQILQAASDIPRGGTSDITAISYGNLQTGNIAGNSISSSYSTSIANIDAFCGTSSGVVIGSNPIV